MPTFARSARRFIALAFALFTCSTHALDFRCVRAPGAVLFDAPSASAGKLFILGPGYPVEVVVSVEGWFKVRDATGAMAWIPVDRVSEDRNVIISVARASIRKDPTEGAQLAFEAEQGVMLKVLDATPGWLKVQHRDGVSGYVRTSQVWGK